MLHACFSFGCGHSFPPESGAMVTRERVCDPIWLISEQDVEHADHTLHDPTLQSTGHAKVLQEASAVELGHALPPNLGSLVWRVRFC